MTQINNYVVGTALTLAIAAFVLALWPAVADAPWENRSGIPQGGNIPVIPSQVEQCLRLAESLAVVGRNPAYGPILQQGVDAGCWD